jgi:hypothetical protein
MTDSSLKAGGLSISHITIERSMRKMHDLQKSIHLTYRTPMHVDELRTLDDTPVAASTASSWSGDDDQRAGERAELGWLTLAAYCRTNKT